MLSGASVDIVVAREANAFLDYVTLAITLLAWLAPNHQASLASNAVQLC